MFERETETAGIHPLVSNHLPLQRVFSVWRPSVEPQKHGLVDPVGDEEEQEGQAVHGENSSGVGHGHEQEREKVRVASLCCAWR